MINYLSFHPRINAGIYKTYLVDTNGDNVEIFNAIDYFVDSTFNPYDTSNVIPPPIKQERKDKKYNIVKMQKNI
jgi:hypothetical protein